MKPILSITCFLFLTALHVQVHAQPNADQAAEMLLNAARKGQNEKQYSFAIGKYREFLQKHGNHPQVHSARIGLFQLLFETPERNLDQAIEAISPSAGAGHADQAVCCIYLALAQREHGYQELRGMQGKSPNDANPFRQRAENRFNEANRWFREASQILERKSGKLEEIANVTEEIEQLLRARTGWAEMELRLNRAKEARNVLDPLFSNGKLSAAKNRHHLLYVHGLTSYAQQDYLVAGRAFSQLAPFQQPQFGFSAQFHMGRIYHLTGDPTAALIHYQGTLQQVDQLQKQANDELQKPDAFKERPWERKTREDFVKTKPDAVIQATFFMGVIQYDNGQFAEALNSFRKFKETYPNANLVADASLRMGYCQLELKQANEAIQTLTALVDKEQRISDQVYYWLGKAYQLQAQSFPEDKPNDRDNALRASVDFMRKAVDRAAQLQNSDPDAKKRRAEFMFERGEAEQLAKMYREAGATWEQLLNENALPERKEDLVQRILTAAHFAGDYPRTEHFVQRFQNEHNQSSLMPAVALRHAENAYMQAQVSMKRPDRENLKQQILEQSDEAGRRYRNVVDRYPDYEKLAYAKVGLAMTFLAREDFAKALPLLEQITPEERQGELAVAHYLQAETILRSLPAQSHPLEYKLIEEKCVQARKHLEAFIQKQPKAKEIAEAQLKLGYTLQRQGTIQTDPNQRTTFLTQARETFEKLQQQHPNLPVSIQATVERAKCLTHLGDKDGAINELKKFTTDPMIQSVFSPQAVIVLTMILREVNRIDEATQIIAATRPRLEQVAGADKIAIGLVRFHHGICVYEQGKWAEARPIFESAAQVAGTSEVTAEAYTWAASCRIREAKKNIAASWPVWKDANQKPEKRQEAERKLNEMMNILDQVGGTLEQRSDEFRERLPMNDARARMYYEAAWAFRGIAEYQIERERQEILEERNRKAQKDAFEKGLDYRKPVGPVEWKAIKPQHHEERTQRCYQKMMDEFGTRSIAVNARLELGELYCEREDYDNALKLFQTAAEKGAELRPIEELAQDQLRLRLGQISANRGQFKDALEAFDSVANKPKSPLYIQAMLRSGECLIELGQANEAIERLKIFRDKGEYHHIANTSDRGMLKLGLALIQAKQWEAARNVYEQLLARYGNNSPWYEEARYQLGWSWQNQGNLDQAIQQYGQLLTNPASIWTAKANLQMGICKKEQKKWGEATAAFLTIPFAYDYAELNPLALHEAANCLAEEKKTDQAQRLLQRLQKDYPTSPFVKRIEDKK